MTPTAVRTPDARTHLEPALDQRRACSDYVAEEYHRLQAQPRTQARISDLDRLFGAMVAIALKYLASIQARRSETKNGHWCGRTVPEVLCS